MLFFDKSSVIILFIYIEVSVAINDKIFTFYVTRTLSADVDGGDLYCSPRHASLCQGKGVHIGCQYPEPGPGEACENYTKITFNDKLKQFVIHYINRRRHKIANGQEKGRGGAPLPKPQIMMFVDWDRELATLAQRLADQCIFAHDECRATVRYPYAGQAVGEVRWRRSSEPVIAPAIRAVRRVLNAWWSERRKVEPRQLFAPFRITNKSGSGAWGHFSQLAVWSLRAMGCGAAVHGGTYAKLLLVCDFSHTNMLGQSTLKAGPLAPCPYNTIRKSDSPFHLLCAPIRHLTLSSYNIDASANIYDSSIIEPDFSDDDDIADYDKNIKIKIRHKYPKGLQKNNKKVEEEDSTFDTDYKNGESDDRDTANEARDPNVRYKNKDGSRGQKRLEPLPRNRNERYRQDGGEAGRKRQFSSAEMYPLRTAATRPLWPSDGDDETTPNFRRTNYRSHDYYDMQTQDTTETPEQFYDIERMHRLNKPSDTIVKHERHNWQQTRNRPQRPGASALLTSPKTTQQTRRMSVKVTLMLDREDVEQLFRDTGFSIKWKNRQYG